jgi:hypothetical protein
MVIALLVPVFWLVHEPADHSQAECLVYCAGHSALVSDLRAGSVALLHLNEAGRKLWLVITLYAGMKFGLFYATVLHALTMGAIFSVFLGGWRWQLQNSSRYWVLF